MIPMDGFYKRDGRVSEGNTMAQEALNGSGENHVGPDSFF
jgi:hypothetical protein